MTAPKSIYVVTVSFPAEPIASFWSFRDAEEYAVSRAREADWTWMVRKNGTTKQAHYRKEQGLMNSRVARTIYG
jgi:hypothetical protein